ncbi:DE Adenylate cyclase associated [Dictyocaulus viviparus]|uniref:DE Adenylate cyclase associated n=1 Tax=Dictyocaulus viviparus TaxID=29172 RepID=A0A0D8XL76_DICVI|nr:DE Adenylate cyclase associated [Dictyocaulus viviparus]
MSMDLLCLKAPKPYEKYSLGYRPLNKALAQAKSIFISQPSENDAFAFCTEEKFISHITMPNIEDNFTLPSRNYFHENVSFTIRDDNHLNLSTPTPSQSAICRETMTRNDYHIKQHFPQSFDEIPSNLRVPDRYDRFLKNLKLQNKQIEKPQRDEPPANVLSYSLKVSKSARIESSSNMSSSGSLSLAKEVQSCSGVPSFLHKTQSDSSIFQECNSGWCRSRNALTADLSSTDENHFCGKGNSLESCPKWNMPKEEFSTLKRRRETSWITRPPPTFSFKRTDGTLKLLPIKKCEYEDLIASKVTANGLDGGRLSKFKKKPWISDRIPHFLRSSSHIPSSEGEESQLQTDTLLATKNAAQSQKPLNNIAANTFTLVSTPKDKYSCVARSKQNYLPRISTCESCYFLTTGSTTNAEDDHAVRCFVRPSLYEHEKNSNDVDVRARFCRSQSKLHIGAKNSLDSLENSHFCLSNSREIPCTLSRSKEKTFAIVSRPQTPPASLQIINEFIPLICSPQDRSTNTNGRDLRYCSNVSSMLNLFSDAVPYKHNTILSTSSYDNENKADSQQHTYIYRIASHSSKHVNATPIHGILVKSHEGGPRPIKKVVFQCDSDGVDRLLHNNANAAEAPADVKAFDNALSDLIEQWSSVSDQIGGDVMILRNMVVSVFSSLRLFLWTAASQSEPSPDEVQRLVAPIVNLLSKISDFKDSKRNTAQFNHLCAVAEGIPAVGWVLVKKTPAPYVKEMLDSAMFYINRILKEFKESDQRNVEWARLWKQVLEAMNMFVRRTHTTGLVWNSAPGCSPPLCDRLDTTLVRPTQQCPPPPPPPPPSLFADSAPSTAVSDGKAGRDALFAEINKGQAITAGLKKVTAEMQTHKNPALREQKINQAIAPRHKEVDAQPLATPPPKRYPPSVELKDGKQWNVEYMVGNRNVVINVTDKKQTVYIYKCENSVIIVKGKLNSITLDSCRKTSIVFDALVAQCETINCQSIQIQTLGEMPTLSIQKTDGCQVYLSEAAKNAEVVTSKSSEMNLLIPGADGDFVEFPVPEQFKTTFDGGRLVTCVSDLV